MDLARLEEILGLPREQHQEALLQKADSIRKYFERGYDEPDFIPLFYEILASIPLSIDTNVAHLFIALSIGDIYTTTEEYLMNLPLVENDQKAKNQRFWSNPNNLFLNLANTLKILTGELPQTAADVVPSFVKTALYTLVNIEKHHGINFDENVTHAYENLRTLMNEIIGQHKKDEDARHDTPPEHFSCIPVYPTASEINSDTHIFLRKNKIKGPYKDLDDYLDVQYRLIREDFVAPLRNDICAYLAGEPEKSLNIKIHKNVRIFGIRVHQRMMGYLIRLFAPDAVPRNMSERFMYGSLVCLTQNNFGTICCGRVIDSSEKVSVLGCILISVPNRQDLQINATYTMVECDVYFEPYYHVMNSLLSTRLLSMEKYLVHIDNDIDDSEYHGENVPFQYCDDFGLKYLFNYEVPFRETFNDSQKIAFDAAIKKELCVIQGPPGTGKTFLGLHIARELLQRRVWPILVVCFTNHALDQFLEGLLDTTNNIIRIGGQSKSEKLKKFNFQILKDYHYLKEYYSENHQIFYNKLNARAAFISMLCQYTHIIDFGYFKFDPRFKSSWFARATRMDILKWLMFDPASPRDSQLSPSPRNWRQIKNLYQEDDAFPKCIISIPDMDRNIKQLELKIRELEYERKTTTLNYVNTIKAYEQLQYDYIDISDKLQMLQQLEFIPQFTEINVNYDNPRCMTSEERWLLYGAWINELKTRLLQSYHDRQLQMDALKFEIDNATELNDARVLRCAEVIGMTTTSAARIHNIMSSVHCPIVIVEEAAEVLEAHIITALPKLCRKLILIGDHKQLKPATADYQITTKYKLGISLFERLVNNGIPCYTLTEQRRMRTEIAALISPSIYPILRNGVNVEDYPTIRGMSRSVFFITHQQREEITNTTRKNVFEAQYLMLLARHLVFNGYDPKRITMLAAYSGQAHEMERFKRGYQQLHNMRICVLDNFQGEENDIILLSLVRNNTEGINGFLNLENRVCVALSRARHGLYIMGNMPQLCKGNSIWPKVAAVLKEHNAIGEYLTSHCVNHPRTATQVNVIADFDKMPKGGCTVPCNALLNCGHICKEVCHAFNHDYYVCTEPCTRVLCEKGHICPDRCFANCGNCLVPRQCDLPCGHIGDVPCFQTPEEYQCRIQVQVELSCGHINDKNCFMQIVDCTHPCDEDLPCGHTCPERCHISSDKDHKEIKCVEFCKKFNVGCKSEEKHQCLKRCFEACGLCEVAVQRERKCGHVVEVMCWENVQILSCSTPCQKQLPCGHICTRKCSEKCICLTKVLKKRDSCDHEELVECGMGFRSICAKPCEKILECDHKCERQCGQTCNKFYCTVEVLKKRDTCQHEGLAKCGRGFETFCQEVCEKILPCGHKCARACNRICREVYCKTPVLKERSGCGHKEMVECRKSISSSCKNPCEKLLPCGHKCEQICSEPCHPLHCKILTEKNIEQCAHQVMLECNKAAVKDNCSKCNDHKETSEPCGEDTLSTRNTCGKLIQCGHKDGETCVEIYCAETVLQEGEECKDQISANSGNDIQTICQEPCFKLLPCGHKYKRECGELCDQLFCTEMVPKYKCNHRGFTECGIYSCSLPCQKRLPCGHQCYMRCDQICDPHCSILVQIARCKCGHTDFVECAVASKSLCTVSIEVELECGHILQKKCWQALHQLKCSALTEKEIEECGHSIVLECYKSPLKEHCYRQCAKILPCGHKCLLPCGKPCQPMKCEVIVPISITLPCGHNRLNAPCKFKNKPVVNNLLLGFCAHLCNAELECGHRCQGTCGSCAQGRFHVGCKDISCRIKPALPNLYNSFREFYSVNLRKYESNVICLSYLKAVREKFIYPMYRGSMFQAWYYIIENILKICSAYQVNDVKMLDKQVIDYLGLIFRKCSAIFILHEHHFVDFNIEMNRLRRIVALDCLRLKYANVMQESTYNSCKQMVFQFAKYSKAQDTIIKNDLESLCTQYNDTHINVYVTGADWIE